MWSLFKALPELIRLFTLFSHAVILLRDARARAVLSDKIKEAMDHAKKDGDTSKLENIINK